VLETSLASAIARDITERKLAEQEPAAGGAEAASAGPRAISGEHVARDQDADERRYG